MAKMFLEKTQQSRILHTIENILVEFINKDNSCCRDRPRAFRQPSGWSKCPLQHSGHPYFLSPVSRGRAASAFPGGSADGYASPASAAVGLCVEEKGEGNSKRSVDKASLFPR